jgi:fibronectin type III domain protein
MLHKLHRGSLLFAMLSLAACSQTPTAPSRTSARPDGAAAGPLSSWASQTSGVAVADWECLTEGVGCPFRPEFDMLPAEDAPSAPANLAFQVSGSTVILTWSPPAGGGATATYVLEAGTAAGQSNIVSFATGGTTTTFTATGVPNGTYFVRVRARNADGTSGPSNEATVVVGGGGGSCQPPGAPPPANFTASASGNTVTLAWTAVAGAIAYVIEAGSSAGASNIIVFDTGSTATTFTGNAPNGTYYLRVRVRTACGTSAASNEAALTVGGAPPPPGSNVTGRWIGLQANGDGATSIPNECGVERWDWQLDLVQSGTAVSGTLTQTTVASGCDPIGEVKSLSLTGSVSGSDLTLTGSSGPGKRFDITATFTATRMTGTALAEGGAHGRGTFAVNRQ